MSDPDQEFEFEYHRPWEEEKTFNDVLADTLSKAPYLLASIGIHGFIALLLAGLAFLRSEESVAPTIEMVAEPPPPLVEEEEEPEPEPIEEPIEEPVLQESEIEEEVEETLEDTGDPDFAADSPFDAESFNNATGLGGGAGGKYGGRGGRGGGKRGNATERAVAAGLKWLHDHQTPDGYWDCDEFMYYDKFPDKPPSDGEGSPVNDVGITGLSLLAFLGHGNTMSSGEYRDTVARGINWLRKNQLDSGLFGEEVGNPTLYNHSIATMALGEAYYFSKSPSLKKPMKKAVSLIVNSKNPYGVWRYSLEPNGANDTSITSWMVFALKTATDGGFKVDSQVWNDSENWFAQLTDPATGRTGYAFGRGGGPGGPPSRHEGYEDTFPSSASEALTAATLLCRIFMTDTDEVKRWRDHELYDILKKQADLCVNKLPVWDAEGGTCDFYYWYYGTFALNQWGGDHWKKWKKAIEKTLLENQQMDDAKDNFYGSWDPVGPWGDDGGRVYSTALGVLILEVYYRYGQVLGQR